MSKHQVVYLEDVYTLRWKLESPGFLHFCTGGVTTSSLCISLQLQGGRHDGRARSQETGGIRHSARALTSAQGLLVRTCKCLVPQAPQKKQLRRNNQL